MDHAARGAAALGTDPLSAISYYTKALIEHPTSPDYYVQRSTAFTRLKDPFRPCYDLALHDADLAVLLAQRRAKREKIQAAQQRRVVALFGLQRYGDAAAILETMVRWRGKDNKKDQMEGEMWKKKIEQKMQACGDNEQGKLKVTVTEYPEIDVPSDAELKKKLECQLGDDGKFKLSDGENATDIISAAVNASEKSDDEDIDEGIGNLTEVTSLGASDTTEAIPANEIKVERSASISHSIPGTPKASVDLGQAAGAPTLSKVRHEWFQNPQAVTITIYAKNVPKDKADIDISEDSLFISFPHPFNPATAFTFSLEPLFSNIEPSLSRSSIMSTKVEVILWKKTPGEKWASLERIGTEASPSTIPQAILDNKTSQTSSAPAYPTSSKSGPKDWDKLAADLTAQSKTKERKPKKDGEAGADKDANSDVDSEYGGDPVDGFFKKLYANADDDTRRAMMKSFEESGGTSLSTNWSEVGKGRVEPVKGRDED